MRDANLLTIGQLSELAGVPVRTIRFYSDQVLGGRRLLEPAGRSDAGYRLYDFEAAARLELIRTLRDLGVGLPTIAKVLARELTVAQVARAHAEALEATVRTLRVRTAVLRAVASRDTDWEELELMNRLAKLDASERRRILDGFVDRVFDGIEDGHQAGEQFAAMMRAAVPDLPQEPTEQQVQAWVELVELIRDEDFITRSREMAAYGAAKRARLEDEAWEADQKAFATVLAPRSEAAWSAGLGAGSAEGRALAQEIFRDWAEALGRPADEAQRRFLLESLTTLNDPRVSRFWRLVGIVGDQPELAAAGAPTYESMRWLAEALGS
ncbi:MerR family transcriptional regulator [Actinospica robiniae]|uniref:MerR family transcriptional regulator n=1 Tax=Actinospica robiniae TaxID=304901 RepID=UPI00054E3773|nr:MerR family transcriptional regulator [Actinospica robiniae]